MSVHGVMVARVIMVVGWGREGVRGDSKTWLEFTARVSSLLADLLISCSCSTKCVSTSLLCINGSFAYTYFTIDLSGKIFNGHFCFIAIPKNWGIIVKNLQSMNSIVYQPSVYNSPVASCYNLMVVIKDSTIVVVG